MNKTKFKNGDLAINTTTKEMFVVRDYWGYCMVSGNIYGAARLFVEDGNFGCTISDKYYRKATDEDIVKLLSVQLREELTNNYWMSL